MGTDATGPGRTGGTGSHLRPARPGALRRADDVVPLLVVALCAAVAAAARIPGIGWSLRPDESGYTIVGRSWDPSADSLYGPHWVDRPPLLIALFRWADALGGPTTLREVAVGGCALLVLAASGVAAEVARAGSGAGVGTRSTRSTRSTRRVAVVLTAIGTTAFVSHPSIDLVAAKGEVLALPLLVGAIWLTLRGVRLQSAATTALAGLVACTALGLKQNLVGPLCFGVALLVVEGLRGGLPRVVAARLGTAFVAGAAVPVLATLAWAVAVGVHPGVLWESVLGFRAEALDVITSGPVRGPLLRAADLVGVLVASGAALLLLWFVLSLRRVWRQRPGTTAATAVVLAVDVTTLVLGGSFWRPYLFGLVPAVVLALALLSSGGAPGRKPARSRVVTVLVVALMAGSTTVAAVRWARDWPGGDRQTVAALTGRAIGAASRQGDSLTVFGGRADIQLASGLPSPYTHLWSLPARTMDPGSHELAALLAGPAAPTWVLLASPLDTWDDRTAASVGAVLDRRYERVANACGGRALHRLATADRSVPAVSCARLR